jgi:8-oxo-dGTP diphosphatase
MNEANAASVALIRADEVLLIQRAFPPFQGLWTLPGGRREPDETIEECAIREVREELGLGVFALQPVITMAIGDAPRFLLAVFATTGFEGVILPSDEILDYRWMTSPRIEGLATTPDLDNVLRLACGLFEQG